MMLCRNSTPIRRLDKQALMKFILLYRLVGAPTPLDLNQVLPSNMTIMLNQNLICQPQTTLSSLFFCYKRKSHFPQFHKLSITTTFSIIQQKKKDKAKYGGYQEHCQTIVFFLLLRPIVFLRKCIVFGKCKNSPS